MFRNIVFVTLMIASSLLAVRADTANDASTLSFAPGQEWSIKSASPISAKVVIGRVEEWKGKVAIHVSIIDITIPQGTPGAGSMIRIGHVAFEKSALAASVDQLLATGMSPAPSFQTGYQQWENEQGDLSAMSVPQTIAFGLAAMNKMHR